MLTMLHQNHAALAGDVLRIDRKFLAGMAAYANAIAVPITTVHAEAAPGAVIMDEVSVPLSDLPYQVMLLKTNGNGTPLPPDRERLRQRIAASTLVYGGEFGSPALCRDFGKPQIFVLENGLRAQIVISASEVRSPLRKLARTIRRSLAYMKDIPNLARATKLHCNGFPIYYETQLYNKNRLLYFDSRMSRDQVISEGDLQRRLGANGGRPLKLFYSGRFEPIKGSIDAVRVGIECIRSGIDIEMHFFGQGSLKDAMARLATESGNGQIFIHDSVPYPELVRRSRDFDIFVCCHVQDDPSCTYLEAFGSGLPIVGYRNSMWRHLQRHSSVGYTARIGDYRLLAAQIGQYAKQRELLQQHSNAARRFALTHCFEAEFKKRTDDINAVLNAKSAARPGVIDRKASVAIE